MANAYSIAICHQKGGVGKTTTTAGLGSALAERGLKTLLVDLDPAANLTTGLGIHADAVQKPFAAALMARDALTALVRHTTQSGLDILPSRADHTSGNRDFYLRLQQANMVRNYFNAYRQDAQRYDFILLDCPPTLGPMAIAALASVELAVIPVQCEVYSLQALDAVFAAIKATRADTNPNLRYRLLITMFDRRGTIHARMLDRLRQQVPSAILNSMIGFDSKVRESQVMGVPILLHAPKTRAAEQFRALAGELSEYARTPAQPPALMRAGQPATIAAP